MYFNTLIIMNEDALGYGNRSRRPSGYCKLSTPNKVICYVQGLRQLPEGQVYRLYLTSKSKQQGVEVGMIQVAANGSKETRWVMNPASINNSGINAKEIDGALIVVDGENIKGTVVPLVGFTANPYDWGHLIKTNKTEPQSPPAMPPMKEPLKVEVEEPKIEEAIVKELVAESVPVPQARQVEEEQEEENVLERQNENTYESIIDTVMSDEILSLQREIEDLNNIIEESRNTIQRLESELEVNRKSETEEEVEETRLPDTMVGINEYVNDFIRQFGPVKREQPKEYDILADKFGQRIPINPFEAKGKGIKWVRITLDDLKDIPSLSEEWINQPFIAVAHTDYKHFILGRDEAEIAYYLGVPGMYDVNQRGNLDIDKIERFSCCKDTLPKAGEPGYWIARV